jgi:hypothetical protein
MPGLPVVRTIGCLQNFDSIDTRRDGISHDGSRDDISVFYRETNTVKLCPIT